MEKVNGELLMDDPYQKERDRMVAEQIVARGVSNPHVLRAMKQVPRHLFVPDKMQQFAYRDEPLGIGFGQTISQPFVVAYMTEKLNIESTDTVLEIGTGSGYQTAILAELTNSVFTIEISEALAVHAESLLEQLGYNRVHCKTGDGYGGWPEYAPFDRIMITAAPPQVPGPLLQQLKTGGRLVAPVGEQYQKLLLIEKTETETKTTHLLPVRFVPMTGEAEKKQLRNSRLQ